MIRKGGGKGRGEHPLWRLGQLSGRHIAHHQRLGEVYTLQVDEGDGTQIPEGFAELVVLDHQVGNLFLGNQLYKMSDYR